MKTLTRIRIRTVIVCFVALWSFCGAAFAQSVAGLPEDPIYTAAREALATGIQTPAAYQNLPSMSRAAWANLDAWHKQALDSSDPALQEQAMQNIIYLRTHYPDGSGFGKSFHGLYRIYRSDAPDNYRIMAAVALRALDYEWPIELMRRELPNERSERVARITARLIADYDASRYR
jgi:hypothetical protein